jgi:hypothetical protein
MVVGLLYIHEHIPLDSTVSTSLPEGIWWEPLYESYVCRRDDPNFETTYWKYQYQIGGFRKREGVWLAQVGEGQVGECVFLQKRNGSTSFVRLTSLVSEDDEAQYFTIKFLPNEFDGEYLSFGSDGSDDESGDDASAHSDSRTNEEDLAAAIALMQLRAKPFIELRK